MLFLAGMIAARLFLDHRIPAPGLLAAGGTAAFFGVGAIETIVFGKGNDWLALSYGAAASVAMLGYIQLERDGRIKAPRFFVYLGEASYSIYLIHLPALILIAKVAVHVPAALQPALPIRFFLFVIGAVAVGCGLHSFVEKPLLALLRGRRRAPAVQSAAVSA